MDDYVPISPLETKPSLRIDELADLWSVSTHTIYKLIRMGKLNTFLKGKKRRIAQEERLRFERENSTLGRQT